MAFVRDRLVCDSGDFLRQQFVGEIGNGCEVKVGEQREVGAEVGRLIAVWLLHLHDHVGLLPNVGGLLQDLRARLFVLAVRHGGACAGVGLDKNFVASIDQSLHTGGHDANAEFKVFHFFRNANDHD